MEASWRSRGLLATAAAAAVTLPLWLGSCAPAPLPRAAAAAPAGAARRTRGARHSSGPAPPAAAPPPRRLQRRLKVWPAGHGRQRRTARPFSLRPGPTDPSAGDHAPSAARRGGPGAPPAIAPARRHGRPATGPGTVPRRPPARAIPPVPDAARRRPGTRPVTAATTSPLDDGGSRGVRFGCNDSLVQRPPRRRQIRRPLPAAMNTLLAGSAACARTVQRAGGLHADVPVRLPSTAPP